MLVILDRKIFKVIGILIVALTLALWIPTLKDHDKKNNNKNNIKTTTSEIQSNGISEENIQNILNKEY